jgi:hypothetical protein
VMRVISHTRAPGACARAVPVLGDVGMPSCIVRNSMPFIQLQLNGPQS